MYRIYIVTNFSRNLLSTR